MKQENWNKLSFFEQMSNVDGDVQRLVRAHESYLKGDAQTDYGEFYLNNVIKLIKMILLDEKNSTKAYRAVELMDEIEEIKAYLAGQCSGEYILHYWNSYTNAIS